MYVYQIPTFLRLSALDASVLLLQYHLWLEGIGIRVFLIILRPIWVLSTSQGRDGITVSVRHSLSSGTDISTDSGRMQQPASSIPFYFRFLIFNFFFFLFLFFFDFQYTLGFRSRNEKPLCMEISGAATFCLVTVLHHVVNMIQLLPFSESKRF